MGRRREGRGRVTHALNGAPVGFPPELAGTGAEDRWRGDARHPDEPGTTLDTTFPLRMNELRC